MNNTINATQQYILRTYKDSDLNDLFCLLSDQDVNMFLPWFTHNTVLETKRFIEGVFYNNDCFYVIEDSVKHHIIGYISLSHIDEWHIHGELEYALLKEYWGKGIICSVFNDFITLIKKQHFEYVYTKSNCYNKRSERVLEKIGMVFSHQFDELWKPKNMRISFKYYKLSLKEYRAL